MKFFLLSLPKSGTYLFCEILKNLGFKYSNLHISTHNVMYQKNVFFNNLKILPDKYIKKKNLRDQLN